MPFKGEQKNQYSRDKRAEKKKERVELNEFLDPLREKDESANGVRHLSESLSWVELGKIYRGLDYQESEEDEKKKIKRPDPSTSKILGMERSFEEWLNLRDQARKDLFWLGKTVLKKDWVSEVHQIVCDQFVQKDFDGAWPAGYTLKDVHDAIKRQERFDQYGSPTREMTLLDSRGFYKTTIDGVDVIQWMLNVPDIRIFLLTGVYKQGVKFLRDIKAYLYWPDRGDFTDMHLLFPEYIIRGRDGTSALGLVLDVRKHKQPDESIWVNSLDASLSGGHCDIRKNDDVVTDSNSNSEDARESLKDKFDTADGMRGDWGFTDNIGTRYFPKDLYGLRLQAYRDHPEESALKYFCRGCWTVKPEYAEVPLKELTEDMVILEVICDQLSQSELVLNIINLNKKWNPKRTLIENSNGADWLKAELQRLAPVFGVSLNIFWKNPSTLRHAKRNRIKGLEILLNDDRLYFVAGSWIDRTFYQMTMYTGEDKNRGRKDDIPDAMSYFHTSFFPVTSMNQKDAEEAKAFLEEEKKKYQIKANYDRIFGRPPDISNINFGSAPPEDTGWVPKWPTKK